MVVLQIQSAQSCELIEIGRDLIGEVVSGKVKANKITESEQKVWKFTAGKVPLQVEVLEIDK